jgi:hypothetical protein
VASTENGKKYLMTKRWRKVLEVIVVSAYGLTFAATVTAILFIVLTGKYDGYRDFISFWATGQRLAHHENPYDADAILQLEHSAGFPLESGSMVVRNPPTALMLLLPLGYLGMRGASFLWSSLLLVSLVASVRINLSGRKITDDYLPIVAYTFGPALACILYGQSSLFVLLGISLFLYLHSSRPILAGVSLWLCALKPHLLLPFGSVLLLWVFTKKAYGVLAGLVVSLLISGMVALYFDPAAWSHYRHTMATSGLNDEYIPCISVAFRDRFSPHSMVLQFVPSCLGMLWAVWYYIRNRNSWKWEKHGLFVLLISLLVAPYGWFTDQAVSLPALVAVLLATRSRLSLALVASISVAIEMSVLISPDVHSNLYLWLSFGWIFAYLIARLTSQDERLD